MSFEWSPDGKKIAFTQNMNSRFSGGGLFVKTLSTGKLQRVVGEKITKSGMHHWREPFGLVWSPDSKELAFNSFGPRLSSEEMETANSTVFVARLADGAVMPLSVTGNGEPANQDVYVQDWSPDGQQIAIYAGTNLLGQDPSIRGGQIYVKDLRTSSVQAIGARGSGGRWSPDGTQMLFVSDASDLVEGDTNGETDVFVEDLTSGSVSRVSTTSAGQQSGGDVGSPTWSPDGSRIAFDSFANDLVPNDRNRTWDVFVKKLP